jgi:hypothetical protein
MRRLSLYVPVLLLMIAVFCISVRAQSPSGVFKLDPSIDQILLADSKLELLKGEGSFEGGEGPLWSTPAMRTHRASEVWMPVERISMDQTD